MIRKIFYLVVFVSLNSLAQVNIKNNSFILTPFPESEINYVNNQETLLIGRTTQTSASSSVLEFGTLKALILPRVSAATHVTTPTEGSLIYDYSNGCVRLFSNNSWSASCSHIGEKQTLANTVEPNQGVILGSSISSANGSLIIESTTRALVLPVVEDPINTVGKTEPGAIVYDKIKKCVAVFNGSLWYCLTEL